MAAPTAQLLQQLTEELTGALGAKIDIITDELESSTEAATTTTLLARVRSIQQLTHELTRTQAELAAANASRDSAAAEKLEQHSTTLIESLKALVHELKND